jgi:hypothetical protein
MQLSTAFPYRGAGGLILDETPHGHRGRNIRGTDWPLRTEIYGDS